MLCPGWKTKQKPGPGVPCWLSQPEIPQWALKKKPKLLFPQEVGSCHLVPCQNNCLGMLFWSTWPETQSGVILVVSTVLQIFPYPFHYLRMSLVTSPAICCASAWCNWALGDGSQSGGGGGGYYCTNGSQTFRQWTFRQRTFRQLFSFTIK